MEGLIKGDSSQRHGLMLLGASLVAALVIIGLVLDMHRSDRERELEKQGRRLVRLFPTVQLESPSLKGVLGRYVKVGMGVERNSDFAYLAIWDTEGVLHGEVVRPGASLPTFTPLGEPSTWYLEKQVGNHGIGREVLEFHAPILFQGDLVGSVALGLSKPGYGITYPGYPIFAAIALPVLLLGALAYLLFKVERKPIETLSRQVEDFMQEQGEAPVKSGAVEGLVEGFNLLMEKQWERVHELEEQYLESLTADKVFLYRVSRLEEILDRIPEAIFLLDESFTVTFANSRVESLLGIDKGEMLGA